MLIRFTIALRFVVVLLIAIVPYVAVQAAPQHVVSPSPSAANDCLSTLQFGDTVLCSLTVASEVDQFTFLATAGDHIVVRMASRTTGVEPQLRVVSPSAITVCQTQSYNAAVDVDTCAIPTSGTYTILVNDYTGGNTGNYGLSLQRLNTPVNELSLNYGQTNAAALIAPGEIDAYTIRITNSNDMLFLRMGVTTTGMRPYVRLYGADGTKYCEASSYGAIADLLTCPPLAEGTYTLIVTTFADNSTGNYSLALQRTNNPSNTTALSFGLPRTATLAAAAEVDTYTFTGTANDTVIVRMGSGTSALKPLIRLYSPTGVKLCEAYSYSTAGELGPCLLPATGTYVVLLTTLNDIATGSYGVTIQRVNRPSAATPLPAGITTSSTLTTTGQLATATFTAISGDAIYLRLGTTSSSFKPQVRIFGDDGAKLCEAYSYSYTTQIASCLMPRTGIYTVIVNALNTADVGGYSITMQRINQPEQAGIVYARRAVSGTFTSAGDIDTYSFTGQGNSSVLIRMSTTTSPVSPLVQLFSRDGTRLCAADSYSATAEISTCLLPSDDDYTVIATSRDGGVSGYNLTLTCLSETCTVGQPPEEHLYLPFAIR